MTTLHLRIYDALESLRRARENGDEDLAVTQAGEIEDLVEIAARHGVDIDCGYQELAHAA
ncbi:hypothetical protein HDA32_001542 [Spinactinospora alkalitolerans]|uniref:Uncharacterized protein n=2 Tax=Spinactinospora alkalitolerans TaxID=687207 RepID=A0A852TU79_9ACTN|nr:hypothetical protein [Spinactinospora alkalitolerans]